MNVDVAVGSAVGTLAFELIRYTYKSIAKLRDEPRPQPSAQTAPVAPPVEEPEPPPKPKRKARRRKGPA